MRKKFASTSAVRHFHANRESRHGAGVAAFWRNRSSHQIRTDTPSPLPNLDKRLVIFGTLSKSDIAYRD
ncbi:hypothetical protein CAter282_2544 [Collimonas arenae]|uniref:Uncharacterized protein n=1 Tax=Collimonas arenae TaxID=279058 RepID=A0A127QJP4_9BURK|nr:hypothetical protein [Collimonas arenae]AMP00402.1 hypothetical protein CAter10_2802 [Collimonas arenae]AMP10281.1 hypothetical protein CAter282_2544 [Collimonas arenae]